MDVKEFFETIFGESEGFIYLGWRNDQGELNQSKFVPYPEGIDLALRVVKAHAHEDLYFSPMLYGVPRRKKTTVTQTPVVYADTDLFDPSKFLVAPTMNVESSEGHTQSYWVLDRVDYPKEDVARIARAIAITHDERDESGNKIGVDPSGWDLTQLLRVPGSMNMKPGKESPVSVRDVGGTVYTLEHLAEAYDPENVAAVEIHVASSMPTNIPDPIEVLPRMSNIKKLRDIGGGR